MENTDRIAAKALTEGLLAAGEAGVLSVWGCAAGSDGCVRDTGGADGRSASTGEGRIVATLGPLEGLGPLAGGDAVARCGAASVPEGERGGIVGAGGSTAVRTGEGIVPEGERGGIVGAGGSTAVRTGEGIVPEGERGGAGGVEVRVWAGGPDARATSAGDGERAGAGGPDARATSAGDGERREVGGVDERGDAGGADERTGAGGTDARVETRPGVRVEVGGTLLRENGASSSMTPSTIE